jgi:hypothetical protein
LPQHQVGGDGLKTSYAFAPRVVVVAGEGSPTSPQRGEGPTHLKLEFISSPLTGPPPQEVRTTRLVFEHVVEYHWSDFEFHRDVYGANAGALALVEIEDSPAVADIRGSGRYIGTDLRHYRITFDDHGTYDLVCEKLEISYDVANYKA